jgi:Astacin (Peptidase family M12A)/Divergent InlB B-repeat domain
MRSRPQVVGVADQSSLWPGGLVYYEIDNGSANLTSAIGTFNADFMNVIQWEDNLTACGANPCSTTYVEINLTGTGGRGDVDTIGYPQQAGPVQLNCNTDCSIATILHEMGHIVGLYHEQTRTDRDGYVTMSYDNVIKGSWISDFAVNTQNQQLLTPYDYASVMQYPAFTLSSNGGPVIETIPAGIPLQGTEGVPGVVNQDYSAGDKEAIKRLYGSAPTEVTVTSNPVGLSVVVDGITYTTPQTFSWALPSTHTLAVASGVQTLTGDIEGTEGTENPVSTTFYYTYGRWNDSTAQSHSITVSAGDGSPAFPASSPAIATYSANFIQLVPYTESVFPSSPSPGGSVSVSPAPQTYSGASGSFFVARQQATLTATPGMGYSFYEFNAQAPYFWLPGGISANPKTFYVPDTGNPVAVLGEFTTYPVYSVNVVPSNPIANDFSSNLWAYIDTDFWYTPKNFSPDPSYDGTAWNSGQTHTLSLSFSGDTTDPDEYPNSSNSRFAFSSWSDGGAYAHTTSPTPATSTAYTATVAPQYAPATNFGFSPCGGTAEITTTSPTGDGFYPWGTELSYSATAGSGWTFAGWTYDLTGTTNPAALTATNETLVYANFNITNSPLTLTGLSPSAVAAGSAAFTLTLTGTGFSSGSLVAVNGTYLSPVTFVSSNELQVQVPSTLVTAAGTFDVFVENFPSGSTGCAVFGYGTFAVTGTGPGTVAPAINWSPAAEIVSGDPGAEVLNATTTPAVIGNFTYSATPTGGGSAINVTSGTSALTPGTYTITAAFSPINPQYEAATMNSSLTVAGESVWIVNGDGSISELTGDGTAVSSSAFAGANTGIGIDSGGNLWSVGTGFDLIEETNQVGVELSPILPNGGLGIPAGVAIDGNSQIWVTNNNGTVSQFANDGAALSPSNGFTDTSLSTPTGIAIDLGGSVWIANEGNNSVTRLLGAAAPAAPLATAAANKTTGAKP